MAAGLTDWGASTGGPYFCRKSALKELPRGSVDGVLDLPERGSEGPGRGDMGVGRMGPWLLEGLNQGVEVEGVKSGGG